MHSSSALVIYLFEFKMAGLWGRAKQCILAGVKDSALNQTLWLPTRNYLLWPIQVGSEFKLRTCELQVVLVLANVIDLFYLIKNYS